jgi:hypothetical protein
MLVLIEIGVLMLVVDLLNMLFTSFHILLMATCLLSLYGLFVWIHSCFTSSGIMVEYNCLNTCLYTL